jgi:hypothetical protein
MAAKVNGVSNKYHPMNSFGWQAIRRSLSM